jgi:hypothetical protein
MDRVVSARSSLQEANNALSGARGIIPPLRPPQTLVEISPELNSEVLTGAGEALWEMGSDLWDTVTNPIGSVVDALEGAQELIDDPIETAQEVWEDFTEPYVEDWENGREGEAIGRGLVELGANFIPGYNVIRWLNRFDDANSDDGSEALDAPTSESGSSGGNELPEGGPPSSDSDGPINDPPRGDPPAAGSDESDDDGDSDRTEPSGQEGDAPSGTPTIINPNDRDPNNIRSLTRENESAVTLAEAGYKVEQNPQVDGPKNPDYKIEGRTFDCYAPSSSNPRNIASNIEGKVDSGQTDRIVLNLDRNEVNLSDLKQQLADYPISGLKEIIVVKDGEVSPFFP